MKRALFAIVVFCWAVGSAPGETFDLSWHSIDGGGVMRSAGVIIRSTSSEGSELELSGTIGQPDAGQLTSGDLVLTGGFWFGLSATDCDEDGSVTLLDHASFAGCLGGPSSTTLAGCECFDADRSGAVDLRDFAAAQTVHTGP